MHIAPMTEEQTARFNAWLEKASGPLSWHWRWNQWIGLHYGPIPVALLIAVPVITALECWALGA